MIWSFIDNTNDEYQVSNTGLVRSMDRISHRKDGQTRALKGTILSPGLSDGYHSVVIKRNGERATVKVHKLVANAFLKRTDKAHEINHIDGNKLNNDVSNLEFVTHGYNLSHAIKLGLKNPPPSRLGKRKYSLIIKPINNGNGTFHQRCLLQH